MKFRSGLMELAETGRTPRGVRGLKSFPLVCDAPALWSHPSRGAWIEIPWSRSTSRLRSVAPLAGCVD